MTLPTAYTLVPIPTNTAPTSKAPITVAEAAELLGTSERFIRNRITDGTLKAYRLKGSRLLRIDRAEVEALKQPY